MQFINLSAQQLKKNRKSLIRFFRLHGDRRITHSAFSWIANSTKESLAEEGTIILGVLEENKLIGVLISSKYGIDEAFIAVHKDHRNKNIAKKMVDETLRQLGKFYTRVAIDNVPSLKICLDNNMVAFHLFTGPTGKPTLWLGGGAWNKEDVL